MNNVDDKSVSGEENKKNNSRIPYGRELFNKWMSVTRELRLATGALEDAVTNDSASWRAWKNDWRADYIKLTQLIRESKAVARTHADPRRDEGRRAASTGRDMARRMMELRAERKAEAIARRTALASVA